MNDDEVKNDSVEAVETETPEVEVNHVNDMINIYREDKSKESLKTKDAIKNSADTFGQFIKIPKIKD